MNDPSIQILQFGTGNFLRGFIEPLIEELNHQGESLQVCLVQSTDGTTLQGLRAQDYAYEVYVAGRDQGQTIEEFQSITCIKDGLNLPQDFEKFFSFARSPELKYLISNVTEAGLVWSQEGPKDQIASSFPGRITQWLYTRFEQAPELETILLPCELIPNNGDFLKSLIQQHALAWKLDAEFLNWINLNCRFHNTLVDRIVPGFPKHLEGKAAPYTVQAEPYLFWGIEGSDLDLEKLPFRKCKGVELTNWFAVYAPINTPPAVVKKLNAAFTQAGKEAKMKEKLDTLGFESFFTSSEEATVFMRAEIVRWARVAAYAGIKAE